LGSLFGDLHTHVRVLAVSIFVTVFLVVVLPALFLLWSCQAAFDND
jgi:hypothetical protein